MFDIISTPYLYDNFTVTRNHAKDIVNRTPQLKYVAKCYISTMGRGRHGVDLSDYGGRGGGGYKYGCGDQ